jgi:ABC-type microcin C transport system permease subunit YejB
MCMSAFVIKGGAAVSYMIAESLSVSTQLMVTGLILFRLTMTWASVSKMCSDLKRSSMYSSAAAIVIESAAPVALLGTFNIIVKAISYYHKPEILARRGTLNTMHEVSYSLYFSFYVSGISVGTLC